jgi:hypothetical protein
VATIVAVILIIASLIIIYFTSSFKLTLLSATTINMNPQGKLDGNKLVGTYWSILASVDYTDQISTYQFDNDEAHSSVSSPYWQGKNMTVKNKITLTIDPQQPYYERAMKYSSVLVVPKAYQNWQSLISSGKDTDISANPLYSNHWETITSDWILHTPFVVKVYVNDVLVGEKTIDTVGAVSTDTISLGTNVNIDKSSSEYLTITNLGALQTGYAFPIWDDVVWFSNQYFYLNSEAVQKALDNPYPATKTDPDIRKSMSDSNINFKGSYAYYWYGWTDSSGLEFDGYWSKDGTPYPGDPTGATAKVIDFNKSPGWSDAGGGLGITWRRKPSVNTPPLFPTDKKPDKSFNALSLVEFLEQYVQAVKPKMPSWEPNANSIQFITNGTQNGYLRVYLPWGSFVPLIDIRISTELADTVVWEPPVGDFSIVDYRADLGNIGERRSTYVTVQQLSNVAASGVIKLVPKTSGLYWSFQPQTFGTGTMNKGEKKAFQFDVVNLGQPEQKDFEFQIQVYNSLGQLTDSKTVKGTLLAYSIQGSTLTVRTVDKDTGLDVNLIHVFVTYDTTQSRDGYTSNGVISFDFGGATPQVTITTAETNVYQSASTTTWVRYGYNDVKIELLKQGETPPAEIPWNYILIILLAVVICVVVVIVIKRRWKK